MVDMKIGSFTPDNIIFLAPMAGITDMPFRILCKEQGAGLTYTEMVSAKAMHYRDKTTNILTETHPIERPCAVQIFGHEPELIAEACETFSKREDIALIDINMGCPVPKIVNNGDGSALMKNPKLVREIARAAVAASSKPVTIKTRVGWDESSKNVCEIASIIEEEGIAAITVHGRTRSQMYSGCADWDMIAQVKRTVDIPVIGNGDVKSAIDVKHMLEQTGCDAVMIGRAAQGNPWIFRDTLQVVANPETQLQHYKPTRVEIFEVIFRQYELLIEQRGELIAVKEMRKHVAWYLHGLQGAARIRAEIFALERMDAIKILLHQFLAKV